MGAAVAAALSVAAIALGGCGGGGDEGTTSAGSTNTVKSSPTSTSTPTTTSSGTTTGSGGGSTTGQAGDSHSIRDAVNAVLTSADPTKACNDDYVTAHYLNAAYGGREGCVQAQSPKTGAESLRVGEVIHGDTGGPPARAIVHVVPKGGLYDGDKITVSLVKEDGSWKVDALKSNAPVGP